MLLAIYALGPLYIVSALMLLGAMRQRKLLKAERVQFANLKRIASGARRNV